ncbi:MerR family transcriptional regulator [Kineococcus sp. TRM81007]|nr:MerR family transcriptional regulator [Kineococcus sp. TRM81007]MCI2239464.1 MerR family transcriptional regulator [Kineococcus sp. TRM81007]
MSELMQIGEVAERVGYSFRTIRYYDEMGLVTPSARTPGGFRLYTELDVYRLLVLKRMKPLDFSLDEMRELLGILDALDGRVPSETPREELFDQLDTFRAAADARVEKLRDKLTMAEEFAQRLRDEAAGRSDGSSPAPEAPVLREDAAAG